MGVDNGDFVRTVLVAAQTNADMKRTLQHEVEPQTVEVLLVLLLGTVNSAANKGVITILPYNAFCHKFFPPKDENVILESIIQKK